MSDVQPTIASIIPVLNESEHIGACLNSLIAQTLPSENHMVLVLDGGSLDSTIDEVHIAKDGTGGPACAKQHHHAMKRPSLDWWDGKWVRRPGGSGRELVWFPEPIEGSDCYRAALPEAVLLQPLFPNTMRITSRLSATRQDRFTSWLPMLTPPHNDGGIGGIRVEVRGRLDNERTIRVLGAVSPPSTATAIVVQTVTEMIHNHSKPSSTGGIATIVNTTDFLNQVIQKGIKTVEFGGITQ